MKKELFFKIHTANLLREIMLNPGTEMLYIPINTLQSLLAQVGERAAEINDHKLNQLMIRLTIYSIADPKSPDYDPKRVEILLED